MVTTKQPEDFQQTFSLTIFEKKDKLIIRQKAAELNIHVFSLVRQHRRLYFRCLAKQWEQFRGEIKDLDCMETPVARPTSRRKGKNKKDRPVSHIERQMFRLLVAGANTRKRAKAQMSQQPAKPVTSKISPPHTKSYDRAHS